MYSSLERTGGGEKGCSFVISARRLSYSARTSVSISSLSFETKAALEDFVFLLFPDLTFFVSIGRVVPVAIALFVMS